MIHPFSILQDNYRAMLAAVEIRAAGVGVNKVQSTGERRVSVASTTTVYGVVSRQLLNIDGWDL